MLNQLRDLEVLAELVKCRWSSYLLVCLFPSLATCPWRRQFFSNTGTSRCCSTLEFVVHLSGLAEALEAWRTWRTFLCTGSRRAILDPCRVIDACVTRPIFQDAKRAAVRRIWQRRTCIGTLFLLQNSTRSTCRRTEYLHISPQREFEGSVYRAYANVRASAPPSERRVPPDWTILESAGFTVQLLWLGAVVGCPISSSRSICTNSGHYYYYFTRSRRAAPRPHRIRHGYLDLITVNVIPVNHRVPPSPRPLSGYTQRYQFEHASIFS